MPSPASIRKTCLSRLSTFLMLLVASPLATAQSQNACEALSDFSMDRVNMEITSTQWRTDYVIPASFNGPAMSLPDHCHVEGHIDRRTGVNGVEYAIRFAVNLPVDWNGRFLFQGGGGLNGSVREPLGNQASGDQSALQRGFAVASTDSGHQGSGFDSSFTEDQEALLNFYYLANARVTEVARTLVQEHYGNDARHSYFMGCSTGGREAMIMTQRYPYLYDGVVSGAPAMKTGHSNLALRWISISLNQAADKDENGLPIQGGTFDAVERKIIMDGLLAACDGLDGAEDGLIQNVAGCNFSAQQVACKAGETENCINPEKADAVDRALGGPIDSRGIQVYSRFAWDTGLDDAGGLPGLLIGNNNPPVGPNVNTVLEHNVDAEFIEANRQHNNLGDSTLLNLSSFRGNNGKLIFYHGVSDPWFSAMETVNYYEDMAEFNGGVASVADWSRIFLAPGVAHCAGGEQALDSFDMLGAIVDWVEHDQAPEAITATGNSMPGVSRPLCPYPSYAQYDGSGNMDSADNFTCTMP